MINQFELNNIERLQETMSEAGNIIIYSTTTAMKEWIEYIRSGWF